MLEGADRLLVLEGLTDADNVGSAFRNAAAFGARRAAEPIPVAIRLYRKAIRTSMGSVLRTPYARVNDWPGDLAALKREGFTVVALTPREGAVDLSACVPRQRPERMALLVGSEGPGLSAEAEAMADVRVRIPISSRRRLAQPRHRHRHRALLLHPLLIPNPESPIPEFVVIL